MSEALLPPYSDFVFKQIFGNEETKDEVLLNFLNEVLRETEPKPFVRLTLLNTHLDKTALTDKESILDVRCENEDKKQVNLEIQVANKYDMPKRSLYYSSKLYAGQLEEGSRYKLLQKVISINIVKFEMIPNNRIQNTYHMREDHTGDLLLDDIEIHFLELPKLKKAAHNMDNRLVRWLTFISGASQERWEELAMDTPGLKKAMTTLEFLSQDKEMRALYEMRRKAQLDEQSALDYAESRGEERGEKRGEERGEKRGEERGRTAVAMNLLRKGSMSISEITEVTGLSEAEIEELKKQWH
ncbi:MAG: hypothetical protein K0Q73_4293 [Paenibacillus sp.]|jgi:predicted transposase/invertase (TIGR01784 family)|nr:hypothetical protein [Paenibacillus sp.]